MAQKPTINIGHIPITDHLVLGVVQANVLDGKESFNYLNLKTQTFIGWNPLGNALRDGSIDAAFILAPFAMDIFYGGLDIKLVLLGHKAGSTIIKNKRANIETIQDFKGKTVLIPHYLSIHNLIFDRMLRENGLSVGVGKDVTFEVTAPSEIPEIMEWDEAGSIGGFIVAEPFGSQVVKAGYVDEFALSKDIWPNHPCCVFVIKNEFIQKYPDAVQELTNSFVASGKMIGDDPDTAAEIGAKFLNQDVDVILKVLTEPEDRVTMHELYPILEDFDLMQTYLTETIPVMSGKIDLEKFVDTQFAEEAGAK